MLAMSADHVVAAEGGVWGLIETANGMEVPLFGIDLVSTSLAPRDLGALVIPGDRIDAARATEVGMADVLAPQDEVVTRAEARLAELTALPAAAYAGNKHRLRARSAERVLAQLDADIDGMVDRITRAAG
jgi:enoyl-CoA hydratase/carnithine racemase